jgi:3-oxoacid CoA-transferase B subunit
MDLVAGVRTIFVAMTHCSRAGEHKLLRACTLPLTGRGVVSRIYTDLATIVVGQHGFEVLKLAPGVCRTYLQERTGAELIFSHEHQEGARRG